MKKRLILFILCLALLASLLAGCNRMKQPAVNSDFSDKTIESNGGLAVRYGKYIYYINGLSKQDADNTFGKVVKGAIARLELGEDGKIKQDSITTIVPQIVFGTDKKGGLAIEGDYIYYSTPSTEKNAQGIPKSEEMVLMRSRLDGSRSEVIKRFENFSSTYKVTDGYIIYDIVNEDGDKELRSIDLNSKKFNDKLLASKITSLFYVSETQGVSALRNYVFYTKANENENEYSNAVYVANGSGSVNMAVIQKSSYTDLLHPDGYSISLVDAQISGTDTIKLIYDKTDRGANTTSKGTYSYDFKVSENFAFSQAGETRYSNGANYTKIKFLTSKYALASKSDKVEFLTVENNAVTSRQEVMAFVPEFYAFDITAQAVETVYFKDSKFYNIKLFDIENGVYSLSLGTAALLYDKEVSTTWLAPEIIGDYLYFFNSSVIDNAYALDLTKIEPRNDKSRTPMLIGIMTPEDEIAAF
ncbi:MAG: hypothetical protein ACOYIQ_05870 [Christensenellales bacterium]|jgi:hypothetical protein